MNVSSCTDNTCPPAQQLALSQFLDCFEGTDGSSMADSDTCAKAAGFDVDKIHSCYDNAKFKSEVWDALQESTSKKRPTLTCFPWVEVDGEVLTDDCFGPIARTWPLLKALCQRAKVAGIAPLPAACSSDALVV
mmetsp:Transcript_60068/g.113339  ORF Transcript_60068/g.113339 Transcript_60068/m.113339 type:complete len:134 (+) Transcript_60068:275-676(+)